ncbi:ABC transporter ATP-binding protein [Breoghania sp. L-A4]|uniref:ABC transporter ATP-binding protein n=1 Tax=Breoghania sp. L-A4 TaxID=2304600 RepID=UPI0013C326DB|nr:ABC transporter ATP-binding protein [Breoghania sp. L-A4]
MAANALVERLHLRACSQAPGRQRWESRHLVGRTVLAKRLAMVIQSQDGIDDVKINERTGRIKITFEPGEDRDLEPFLRYSLFYLLFDVRGAVNPRTDDRRETTAQGASANDLLDLLKMFPPNKRDLTAAPLWSVANNLMNFLPELALVGIVNVVNGSTFNALSAIGLKSPRAQVLGLGVAAGAAFAAELATERKRRRAWRKVAQKSQHDIRTATYAHVQDLDMEFIDQRNSGELYNLIGENSSKVGKFLETGADDMFQRAVTAVIIVATLGAVSPLLALTTLAPLPIIAVGSRFVKDKTGPLYAQQQESESAFARFLTNNLGDLGIIKSFTAEDREAARMQKASAELNTDTDNAIQSSARYSDQMRLFISVAFAVAMVLGGSMVAGKKITPAMFTLILFFVPKLLVRMEGMGESYDQYQSAAHASKGILKTLRQKPTIVSGSEVLEPGTVKGALLLDRVTFGYKPDRLILRDFSLEIPARGSIALVGATGSGKSTVVKLLMRFYDPSSGRITLDGRNVRDLDLHSLRRSIGFVSQDVFLFDGSVYDNIAYGRPEASFDEVVQAAKAAEADGFIRELTDGYRAQVGERGRRLSGGQRQRISIARAFLKNPSVFIFDEATSAVDNETEMAIQRSIARVARDRTSILIAHRLSTIRHADRIIVMDDGRIAESGTHEELLRHNGLYSALWRVQTGETSARSGSGTAA